MGKIAKGVGIAGLVALAGIGTYGAVNAPQIRDSYNLVMDAYSLGKEAMDKNITNETLLLSENKEFLQKLDGIINNTEAHLKKYNLDPENASFIKALPTVIGLLSVNVVTLGDYAQKSKYMSNLTR